MTADQGSEARLVDLTREVEHDEPVVVEELEHRAGRQQYLPSAAVGTAAPQCSTEADVQMAQAAVLHLIDLEGQDQSPDHIR